MVDTAEFERDLLARIVQNIKPSKAAIFSGQNYQMSVSHGVETDQDELNMELVEKVVQTEGPVSDKVHKRQLAVPYKNADGKVLGVMYVEIAAPRRLKFRDLAILQGLGRQMVERHWQPSKDAESSLNPETMGEVTRYVRSTLSIVSSVLKPQRVLILVRLEDGPRIVASRGFDDVQDLSAVPFSRELVDSIWEKGETCHIRDALNDPQYSKFAGVQEHSLRSVCVCPLNKLDGEDRGLIYLDSCKDPAEFLTAEVSILQRLALALEKDLARVLAPEPEMGAGDVLGTSGSSILDNDDEYSLPEVSSYVDEPDSFVVHGSEEPEAPAEAVPVSDEFQATEETQEFDAEVDESEEFAQEAGEELDEDAEELEIESAESIEDDEELVGESAEQDEGDEEDEFEPEESNVEAEVVDEAAEDLAEEAEEPQDEAEDLDEEGEASDDQAEATDLADEAEDLADETDDESDEEAEEFEDPLEQADEFSDEAEEFDEEPEQTLEDSESAVQDSEDEEEPDEAEEPDAEPTVEQHDDSTPPPLLDLYDGSPLDGGAEYQYEPSENDLVTITLPPQILDGPDEDEDENEDDTDSDEVEPTVEETAPNFQVEVDSEVESVRSLPVDATVEVSAEIAARALAGVQALQKQQELEDSEGAEEEVDPEVDDLDAESEDVDEPEDEDDDLKSEEDATEAEDEEQSELDDDADSHVGKTDAEVESEEVDEAEERDVADEEAQESDEDEDEAEDVEEESDEPEEDDLESEEEATETGDEEQSELEDDAVSHVGTPDAESDSEEHTEAEERDADDEEVRESDEDEAEPEPEPDEQDSLDSEQDATEADGEEGAELADDPVSHVGESDAEPEDDEEAEEQDVEVEEDAAEIDDDEEDSLDSEPVATEAEDEQESELEDDPVSHVGETDAEPEDEDEAEGQDEDDEEARESDEDEVDDEEAVDEDADEELNDDDDDDDDDDEEDEEELEEEEPQEAAPPATQPAAAAVPSKPPAEVAEQEESLMKYVERGLQAVTPAKNASFLERLKWVFSPGSVPQGGDYSHIHIAGKVVLQDNDWKGDEPIEVTLGFPSHKMTVILEIAKGESDYAYHGRFEGESPVWFEVTVEKPGYFPIKLSKVTFQSGDVDAHGEPSTRVHEITLIPRKD